MQDPKVRVLSLWLHTHTPHTHTHTPLAVRSKSSVSCAVTQNLLNEVKTHHVTDMCFLNQVIKVLVAAAISGADKVFSRVACARTRRTVFTRTRASIRSVADNNVALSNVVSSWIL